MAQYADRYSKFRANANMLPVFGITLPVSQNDKTLVYRKGHTRLDNVSNDYYNNPYCGWLIMLANPQFGGLEFNIPDQSIIRIPFPYEDAIGRYVNEIQTHLKLYGK